MNELRDLAGTKMLNALKIEDVREMVLVIPETVIDCRTTIPKAEHTDKAYKVIYLTPTGAEPKAFSRKNRPLPSSLAFTYQAGRLDFEFLDDAGQTVVFTHFGSGKAAQPFHEMGRIMVCTQIARFGSKFYLKNMGPVPEAAIGKVWPQYKGIQGQVSGERIANVMETIRGDAQLYQSLKHFALGKIVGECGLPENEILGAVNSPFEKIGGVLDALHFPQSPQQFEQAKVTAAKITALAIQASALRQNVRQTHPKAPILCQPKDIEALIRSQPEKLSDDQLTVISQLTERLAHPKPMNGLLSGDVGTGKTLAFLIPAIAAHKQGAKVAIMAPTTILADQIALGLIQRFPQFCSVERIQAGGKIINPNAILVGTSGMQTVMKKEKFVPNVLICDEQHKMATASKEGSVGPWTHTLEVSATPIPRSLASALYGGMDIFTLRKCPVNKQINCVVCDAKSRPQAIAQIRYSLEHGERAAIVYPRVDIKPEDETDTETVKPKASGKAEPEEKKKAEAMSIKTAAAGLEKAFPGQVAILHGQLDADEIRDTIKDVKAGKKNLIVASTVIETGVDIPSISAMIVRDADRFGISQLHQLRGRLVRNGGEGVFIMMVEDLEALTLNSPSTVERLDAVAATTDGYELAEKDLVLRGFGDLEGENQAGNTKTLFKMVKMSPTDFLNKRLKTIQVEATRLDEPEVDDSDTAAMSQPRLF